MRIEQFAKQNVTIFIKCVETMVKRYRGARKLFGINEAEMFPKDRIRGKKFTARQRRAGRGLTIHAAQRYTFIARGQPYFTAIILLI